MESWWYWLSGLQCPAIKFDNIFPYIIRIRAKETIQYGELIDLV